MLTESATWLSAWMIRHEITLWGVADVRGFEVSTDSRGNPYPRAVSFALPMNPRIMAQIQNGPNQAYANEYAWVNERIAGLSADLARSIVNAGAEAEALAASKRTDPVQIAGDFPHKTAATRAGLGWIGRNCQLITRPYGPWVRLGTVFTSLDLPSGKPLVRSFCGRCMRCVEACPAGALKGASWAPGLPREEIL
ncbi:MAG: epoxyqueuosine reductase, partial [Desulfovermiculus sp.]|nr:epoxyqueuosine reductase [Desulfovermiculus sp.]